MSETRFNETVALCSKKKNSQNMSTLQNCSSLKKCILKLPHQPRKDFDR